MLQAQQKSFTKTLIYSKQHLMDKDMNPKIVAFGLARPFRTNKSQITIEHHVGTM